MRDALGASETVALLGVSLYVLGFGTGFAHSITRFSSPGTDTRARPLWEDR